MKVRRFACDRCHGQKLRCPRSTDNDGPQKPCVRCQKAGASCIVSEMQQIGRPRKKARVTSPTKETRNDTPPPIGDSADCSTVSRLDKDCEIDAAPQSTTESGAHLAKSASIEQRLEGLPLPSSENPIDSSNNYPFTPSLDGSTPFLTFDNSMMDMPDVIDEQISSWFEGRAPQESDQPVDIFTVSASSPASHTPKDTIPSREKSFLSRDSESAAPAQDIYQAQVDTMIGEGLHKDSSKSTSYTDLSSSTINSRPLSPVTLDNASPQPPSERMYQIREIRKTKNGKRIGSSYQSDQQEPCGSMPDRYQFVEAPSSLDLGLGSAHKGAQAFLQIQFEIYACCAKFLCLNKLPNRHDSPDPPRNSQSETLGKFFSTAEKFISLVSEPQSAISVSSSPRTSASCPSTYSTETEAMAFGNPEYSTPRTPPWIVQPTSTFNAKPSRSTFDVPETDPAAFHLVLACHIRLMTAYEAIVDAIAAQSQDMGNGNMVAGSVASLSIGGFIVQCGSSLESLLHLQIILHQLDRLSDACYACLSRAQPPNPREDAFCFSPLRGLHERRRRAAPATMRDMAKRMVEEREMALRAKIKSLTHRTHHTLDMDSFYYADDAS